MTTEQARLDFDASLDPIRLGWKEDPAEVVQDIIAAAEAYALALHDGCCRWWPGTCEARARIQAGPAAHQEGNDARKLP